MKIINHTLLLFIIIIIEGYVVLSTELLAIRQTIPYVGSGTDTVSIIIAAVLLPLAFGYHFGGKFKPQKLLGRKITIRGKLVLNILIASAILLFGISHEYIRDFFIWLNTLGIHNRVIQTAIYSSIFLVLPIYLLGQTVPLITNFFSREHLPQITGKILFFSTVGSFIGATFSTLVLMATIGVHHTVSLNFVLLAILVILLNKKKKSLPVALSVIIALTSMWFNSEMIMREYRIVKNNQYNTIVAGTMKNGNRQLFINGNNSSRYNDARRKHHYIEFAEKIAIYPILGSNPPKDILVIGSGGFTFGHEDINNNYTYVDIDKDLLEVAEKIILQEPIGENKKFEPQPARAFLSNTKQKFDVIYLDAYLGGVSIPEHLVTLEFFEQVKSHLKDKGVMVANMILSPNFNNTFSRNIDNTLRAAFPHVSRHIINDHYRPWSDSKTLQVNTAYIYRHEDNYDAGGIYTDNKNTVFYDKPKHLRP